MQMLPLTEVPTEASLAAFIDELAERQLFTKDVADKIDQGEHRVVLSNSRGANFDQVCNTGKTGAAIFNAKRSCHYF